MNQLSVKDSQFKMKAGSDAERWFVFDLETDGLIDKVSVIHCLVIHDVVSGKTFSYAPADIEVGLDHLLMADVLIGHNILFYDLPVIKKLFPKWKTKAHIIDTLICTRLIWPKELLYDEDIEQYPHVPKNMRGAASLKAWGYRLSDHKIEFKDFTQYSEEMLTYCEQDVNVTTKLFKLIQEQNYKASALHLEHRFAQSIERQIRSGFQFDMDKCIDLVDELRAKQKELEIHLKEIFPPIKHEEIFIPKVNNSKAGYVKGQPFTKVRYEEFNPGSRQQIVDRLKSKYGWVPEKRTDKGNAVLDDDVLEKLSYPEAKPLAEYMLVAKRLGQIADGKNAWIKLYNNETGCIHGDVVTNGCITGRCAHRYPNMAQVPAGYSPYGKECRSLFQPPDGYLLLGVDAKALELRCLAGYLALWDKGSYAALVTDESVDIHTYNQEQFGVATRDISKRLLYGMLYGCGAAKAGTIINPLEKDEDVLRSTGCEAINNFLNGVPALRKLKQQIEKSIFERNYLIGLDRRKLHCRSAFKGLNVLLQSAGAIIMKQVVIELHQALDNLGLVYGFDWVQCAMIHDELQLAVCPEHLEVVQATALECFPKAQQFFDFQCEIAGDSRVGCSWSETH